MMNRQLILVAIDRATDATRLMAAARSVARARGADIDVLQVLPLHALQDAGSPDVGPADDGGVRVRRVTLRGTPAHVIPAYGQLHGATLLVVQRDYGSSRFWRSSRVVDALARRSSVPLLVLPPRARIEAGVPELRRILTAVEFSIASAVAVKTAADLSRRHGARLTLMHALENVAPHMVFSGGEAWEVAQRLPAQLDAVATRLRRRAAFLGAGDVDTDVATGNPSRAILEIAARSSADLIVMGIAHRSWLARLTFGSTLRRVLRRTTVPTLVVPVVAGDERWPDEQRVDQGDRPRIERALAA